MLCKRRNWMGSHARKSYREYGAAILAGAVGCHRASLQFHEMTNYGQSQTEPAVFSRGRTIGLAEAVKDVGQKFRWYALTCIAHGDFGFGGALFERDLYQTTTGSELDRIRQKIPDDLLQAVGIA